jgi:Spy/CpxP family protein refolding chaperone
MFKSRWSKVLGVLPLVAALAGMAGCNNSKPADGQNDVAASELGAAPAKDAHAERMMPPRGPAMLLGAALHELDLSDAQRSTIQGELDALRPTEDMRASHEATHKALAAAVRSGKVDEAAILANVAKPKIDTARVAKAVSVLHDTLSAAQRKELVEKVLAKMDRFGNHEGHEGHPWGDKAKEGHERGEGFHGPMGHLLHGIELTDAQRTAVKDALAKLAPSEADREAMKAQHEAFKKTVRERLATFEADQFDANAFVALPEGMAAHGPEKMAEHMVKVIAAVTPILDETQRAELAKRIEEGPMGPPHMGGKGHGPAHQEQDEE